MADRSSTTVPQALQDFYSAAMAQNGIAVADLPSMIRKVCAEASAEAERCKRLMSQGTWKKFIDEVCPVSRFLKIRGIETGYVRFPLDDQAPDAWYFAGDGAEPLGIEVTIALAEQRYVLMRQLKEHGESPGFLPENGDDFNDLKRRAAEEGKAYSTPQALETFKAGISERLRAKNSPRYAGFVLVVDLLLEALPTEYLQAILGDLTKEASRLPFKEVHVVGNGDGGVYGFKLK